MLQLDPQLMREACAVHNIPVADGDSAVRMMRKLLYMEPAETTEPVVEAVLDKKTWCASREEAMKARKLKVSTAELERQWGVIRANKLCGDYFALDRTVYDSMSDSEKRDLNVLLMDVEQVYIQTPAAEDAPAAAKESDESPRVEAPAEAAADGTDPAAINATDASTEAASRTESDPSAIHGSPQAEMREKALQAAQERMKQSAAADIEMPDAAPES